MRKYTRLVFIIVVALLCLLVSANDDYNHMPPRRSSPHVLLPNLYNPPCPAGFVVPDDISSLDNRFVNDTMSNCAIPCKINMFSDSEWDMLENLSRWVIGLGVPLMLVVFAVYFFSEGSYDSRSQYLLICFCAISLVHSCTTAALLLIPFEQRFCRNNANMLDASDGLTPCAVQTFVQLYFGLAICICWCMQSIGVFLKIVVNMKSPPKRKKAHLAAIFGLPMISLVIGIRSEEYGYSYTQTACFFGPQARVSLIDVKIFYTPVFVLTVIGAVCMLSVVVKILLLLKNYVRTQNRVRANPHSSQCSDDDTSNYRPGSNNTEGADYRIVGVTVNDCPDIPPLGRVGSSDKLGFVEEGAPADSISPHRSEGSQTLSNSPVNTQRDGGYSPTPYPPRRRATRSSFWTKLASLSQVWESIYFLRSPLAFLFFFLMVYITVIAIGASGRKWYTPVIRSYRFWAECVVGVYDGSDSWVAQCGRFPSQRASPELRAYLTVVIGGQSLFCAIMATPGLLKLIYRESAAVRELILSVLARARTVISDIKRGDFRLSLVGGAQGAVVLPEFAVNSGSKSKSKSFSSQDERRLQLAGAMLRRQSVSSEEGKSLSREIRDQPQPLQRRSSAWNSDSGDDNSEDISVSGTEIDSTNKGSHPQPGASEFWVTEPYNPALYPVYKSSDPSRPSQDQVVSMEDESL